MAKKRGRRGFGGRWRAFVRQTTLGTTGTPCLRTLATVYRTKVEAGSADIRRAAVVGAAATRAGRLMTLKAGYSSFGPTSRDISRHRERQLRRALLAVASGKDQSQTAVALGERCAAMRTGIAAGLAAARAAIRLKTQDGNAQFSAALATLESFRSGPGAEAVAELKEEFPALQQVEGLVPIPAPSGLCCFEVLPACRSFVADTVAWALQSKQCNASLGMREYWTDAHKPTAASEHMPAQEKDHTSTECLVAGMCLCSAEGRELRRFRNSCLRAMKAAFPAHSEARTGLLDGFVVVRFTNMPSETSLGPLVGDAAQAKDLWLHVGLHYLCPYRPTFMLVTEAPGKAEEDADGGCLWIKVTAA